MSQSFRRLVAAAVLLALGNAVVAAAFLFTLDNNIAQAGGGPGKLVTIVETRWGEYHSGEYHTNFRVRSVPAYEGLLNFLYGDYTWRHPTTLAYNWAGYGFLAEKQDSVFRIEAGFYNNPKNPMVTLNWERDNCLPGPYELFQRDAGGSGSLLVINTTRNDLFYQRADGGWEVATLGEKIIREGITGTIILQTGPQDGAPICSQITWQQIPDGVIAADPPPTSTAEPTVTPTSTPRVIIMTPVTSTPTASATNTPITISSRYELEINPGVVNVGDFFTMTVGVRYQTRQTRVEVTIPPGIRYPYQPECEAGNGCTLLWYFFLVGDPYYSSSIQLQAVQSGPKAISANFRPDGSNLWSIITKWITVNSSPPVTPTSTARTPVPEVTAVVTKTVPTATPPAWLGPVEVATGWNLVGLPCVPLCARSASEVLASFQESGLDATITARWINGLWEVHIRGLGANDFALDPKRGYFIRSRNSGTWEWYMPPTPN